MSVDPCETAEAICDKLKASHRTIQQKDISTFINVLLQYADADCDARNEFSVMVCKEIRQFLVEKKRTFRDIYGAPCI
jgi:hypothetical protein